MPKAKQEAKASSGCPRQTSGKEMQLLALGRWPACTEGVRVRVGRQPLLSEDITASFRKPD